MEIQANELRIGNKIWWLHEEHETVCTVTPEIIADIHLYNTDPNNDVFSRGFWFAPIPLTPEILTKEPFRNKGAWYGLFISIDIYDDTTDFVFEFMDNDLTVFADDTRIKRIENPSVHQVQNIFYEITGKELDITL